MGYKKTFKIGTLSNMEDFAIAKLAEIEARLDALENE